MTVNRSSKRIILWIMKRYLHFLPDGLYLKIRYRITMNKKLDFETPKTFNEKLQWLKMHDRKDIYTTMVDKYEAKKYVTTVIGKKYIIPTLGVYDRFDDIDFDKLPNQFVIKCTHDSGGLLVCQDKSKLDKRVAKKRINKSLKLNYYYAGREWPYKNVKPRIIIEKYMVDESGYELKDYKFFCFNGKVKLFKIDFNRATRHRANYFDKSGKLLMFGEQVCPPDYNKTLSMPHNLTKMIKLAEKLSNSLPFLRVDFYEIGKQVLFGELTFYPNSGNGKFVPEKWDRILGNYINLDLVKSEAEP